MDVAEWLLGLEQYALVFRDNDIDGEVLRRLTGEDLRELGVTSIGHRRRLLDAISALEGVLPSLVETNPSRGPLAPAEAERRQLTVMFCDLVGSTALSARLDPEDLRDVISAYHRIVTETIVGFDGFIAKYMGDGVLIYFGHPRAHEDDAERAVRAGLGVIDAVGRLDTKSINLKARVGLATGLVVVGDLIGEGSAQEQSVVGETPNLAARLQALAAPATVVIAESTRRQIGTLFEIEDLGPQALVGFSEPQRASRVLGESGVLSRFEALRSEATLLVGREEELDLLLRRWHQAKAGMGSVVLVSGEPGIGKSRLSAALSQRIEKDPHTRLRYFRQLAGTASLPRDTVEEIVERADGVPLFVEELTKAVLESGDHDDRVAAVLSAAPLPNLAIPATLHASLIARLDRLGSVAKEVGQIGSVIGREFVYNLIDLVAQRPAELRLGLDRLVEAGLLFCRGSAPQSSYLFKHALVQDAAYGTLLRGRRQELHARVAAVLERHFADLVERQPELLAHHLTAAADTERAVDQWLKAGRLDARPIMKQSAISTAASQHWSYYPKDCLAMHERSNCNCLADCRFSQPKDLFLSMQLRLLLEPVNLRNGEAPRLNFSSPSTVSGRPRSVPAGSSPAVDCRTDC